MMKLLSEKQTKPPLGLDSHRCCPESVCETHPPTHTTLPFSAHPLVTASVALAIITSGENSHVDIPLTIPVLLIKAGSLWDNVRARPLSRGAVTGLCFSFHSAR